MMTPQAAGEILNMSVSDVREIEETNIGTMIRTMDRVRYVVVPDDNPDGAGRTGLMVYDFPGDPAKVGSVSLPIYTKHGTTAPRDNDHANTVVVNETPLTRATLEGHVIVIDGEFASLPPGLHVAEQFITPELFENLKLNADTLAIVASRREVTYGPRAKDDEIMAALNAPLLAGLTPEPEPDDPGTAGGS